MKKLAIDIETYSSVDLSTDGLYKYVESDDFEVLLFAYKVDDEPVEIVDIAQGEEIPISIINAINAKTVLKTAYNASFEIVCLSQYFGKQLDISQWEDTMFRAAYCGYNGSLKTVGEMLGLEQDKQKDKAGTLLINKFSKPRKPTKTNPNTRLYPTDDIISWEMFKEYNKQDVIAECAIYEQLKSIEIPESEQLAWELNFRILSNGVSVDTELINSALELDSLEKKRLKKRLQEITGVSNPKSNVKIKAWIEEQVGEKVESISKHARPKLVEKYKDYPQIVEVFNLLNEYNKTSLAKYKALERMECKDHRIRGFMQFYGSRTGRWAGRGVQVQNLPRNYIPNIKLARKLLKERDYETLTALYGPDLSDTASQLIRTAFIPSDNNIFAVADYSAIEARVIAWLANEEWRLNIFRTSGKIYEASASQMFNIPLERICDKEDPAHKFRAQGKVAELALGYQGGVGAIKAMDFNGDIPEEQRDSIVRNWREKSPNIVKFWHNCERAAVEAIKTGEAVVLKENRYLRFKIEDHYLTIELPSGRKIYYPHAKLETNQFGNTVFSYLGINQTTRKVERILMYGGKIVENIVQAVARDCLSLALLHMDMSEIRISFHVHDEVIVEVPTGSYLGAIKKIMCSPNCWNMGLPLDASGFVSDFYMKD